MAMDEADTMRRAQAGSDASHPHSAIMDMSLMGNAGWSRYHRLAISGAETQDRAAPGRPPPDGRSQRRAFRPSSSSPDRFQQISCMVQPSRMPLP